MNPLRSYILRETYDYPTLDKQIESNAIGESKTSNVDMINPNKNMTANLDNLQHTQQYMMDKFIEYFNLTQKDLRNHNYEIEIDQIKKPDGGYINESFNVIMHLIMKKIKISPDVNKLETILNNKLDTSISKNKFNIGVTSGKKITDKMSWICTNKKL